MKLPKICNDYIFEFGNDIIESAIIIIIIS